MLRQLGPMMQQIQQPCNECEGTGEMMNPKDRCKTCNGKKTNSERKVLEVHIDKGMKSGQQIKFNGESDQSPGVVPGDVVIVVEEKPHAKFQRKGDDLFCEAEIDLLTALGGGEFAIEHLDERALHVTIVPGEVIKPGGLHMRRLEIVLLIIPVGALKVISGQGMPSYRHHELGDLYVKINVKFPESVSPDVIPALESALPTRKAIQTFNKKVHVDEVTLEEPNDRQRRVASNGEGMDEDEDDGRPGVQCAQRKCKLIPCNKSNRRGADSAQNDFLSPFRNRLQPTVSFIRTCPSACWSHSILIPPFLSPSLGVAPTPDIEQSFCSTRT